ncbi:MAG: DUF2330 domain-containing protein [Candidatus Brocadiia bacterium]
MKKWLFLAVGLILLFAAQRECAADGKFFPPLNVKAPDMPQQRAIIVYRDGVERMIVESAFQGETGEYAWILPVPSEPLEIKKASYPLFKTVFYDLGKRAFDTDEGASPIPLTVLVVFLAMGFLLLIVAEANGTPAVFTAWAAPACIAFTGLLLISPFSSHLLPHAAVFALVAVVLFVMRNKGARGIAVSAFLWMLVLAGFLTVLPGSLLKARGPGEAGIPSVQVLNVNTVADCEITTLKADNAEALDKWLEAGGFQTLGEAGRKVAGSYIAESWCFLVGKLRKAGNEPAAPSPIEVSFKTDAPVYPMRLTALAGGPLYVELILVANDAYECPQLQTEFAGTFTGYEGSIPVGFHSISTSQWDIPAFQRFCLGVTTYRPMLSRFVLHSEAGELLWNDCVVSKLSGSLTAAQMNEDIRPGKGSGSAMNIFLTPAAAKRAGIIAGASIFLLVALLATFIFSLVRCFRPVGVPGILKLILAGGILIAVSVAVGLTVRSGVPVAESRGDATGAESELESRYDVEREYDRLFSATFLDICSVPGGPAQKLLALFDEAGGKWPPMTDEMRALLREISDSMAPVVAKAGKRNVLIGGPLRMEESPGNVVVALPWRGQWRDLCLVIHDFDLIYPVPHVLDSYPPPD